jgi:CO dehydrogenase/acetyl-CoA synthase beta subunit
MDTKEIEDKINIIIERYCNNDKNLKFEDGTQISALLYSELSPRYLKYLLVQLLAIDYYRMLNCDNSKESFNTFKVDWEHINEDTKNKLTNMAEFAYTMLIFYKENYNIVDSVLSLLLRY